MSSHWKDALKRILGTKPIPVSLFLLLLSQCEVNFATYSSHDVLPHHGSKKTGPRDHGNMS